MSKTQPTIAELQEQVAKLQEELEQSEQKKSEAEELAKAMSQAGQFIGSTAEEQPTGKTMTVRMCANPYVRKEGQQKWIDVKLPTYFYTIILPTGAGLSLTTNGTEYFHGETYEFDSIALAEMKSRVARCWEHEKSIHGENENAYRKPTHIRVG